MIMSRAVEELAAKTPGKRSLAMEGFAKALRAIPGIICDNGGLDSSELVSQMRAAHAAGESNTGINILTGEVGDMQKCGVVECFRVKQQVLLSGTEAAEMIIASRHHHALRQKDRDSPIPSEEKYTRFERRYV